MLMTTKSLAILFLILSILNIPVYLFYYTGNEKGSLDYETKLQDIFAKLSLGNIGQS